MKRLEKMISFCMIVAMLFGMATGVKANENRYNMGEAVNTGKDNGYSEEHEIDEDDPHYGWELGRFYLTGYTRHVDYEGEDVFLKNVGDEVELRFELLQDIDALDGDEHLSIAEDRNGFDQYFETPQYNDCRGLLIIRKTDYTNTEQDPEIYTDYLEGVEEGADISVMLCEEGDYEVALDYEIRKENFLGTFPSYTNYRIFFRFSIRNGNCMVFMSDVATNSEITNNSCTPYGFRLDLANSRYLDIDISRQVLYDGANTLSRDTRFNRPANDGEEFIEEGLYTIIVRNLYTGESTEKVIYVGTNDLLEAYVTLDGEYSIQELREIFDEGGYLSSSGVLIIPTPEPTEVPVETTPEVTTEATTEATTESTEEALETTEAIVEAIVGAEEDTDGNDEDSSTISEDSKAEGSLPIGGIIAGPILFVLLCVIGGLYIVRNNSGYKKNQNINEMIEAAGIEADVSSAKKSKPALENKTTASEDKTEAPAAPEVPAEVVEKEEPENRENEGEKVEDKAEDKEG